MRYIFIFLTLFSCYADSFWDESRVSRRSLVEHFNLRRPVDMKFIQPQKNTDRDCAEYKNLNVTVQQNSLTPLFGRCYYREGFYQFSGKIIDIAAYEDSVCVITDAGGKSYGIFCINTFSNTIKTSFRLDWAEYWEYGKPVSVSLWKECLFVTFLSGPSQGCTVMINLDYGRIENARRFSM